MCNPFSVVIYVFISFQCAVALRHVWKPLSCAVLYCAACVNWFHCTGSHWASNVVVCNLVAGGCKVLSKQTAETFASSSSPPSSLPLSPAISIFHLLFLSILSAYLPALLAKPPSHTSSQSSHMFPSSSSLCTSWHLCSHSPHEQLVVQRIFSFLVNAIMQLWSKQKPNSNILMGLFLYGCYLQMSLM